MDTKKLSICLNNIRYIQKTRKNKWLYLVTGFAGYLFILHWKRNSFRTNLLAISNILKLALRVHVT